MWPRPPVGPTPLRDDRGLLLAPLAVPPIDDDLDGGVAGEVALNIRGQLRVAARHDEQETIRWARQRRGSTPTDLVGRGIGEQYRTCPGRRRTYSEIDLA